LIDPEPRRLVLFERRSDPMKNLRDERLRPRIATPILDPAEHPPERSSDPKVLRSASHDRKPRIAETENARDSLLERQRPDFRTVRGMPIDVPLEHAPDILIHGSP
jgi:hypothetical protein